MTHIVYSEKEPSFGNEDKGFSAAVRIFQLTVNNNPEPEITMVLEAGKAVNDDRMWYHVIKEDAYGVEPNGQYELLPEDELRVKYNCDTKVETTSEVLESILSGDVTSVVCAFSKSLRVIHLTEDTFERVAPAIAQQPIDVDFMKEQLYFHVMTQSGLIIFKKIMK